MATCDIEPDPTFGPRQIGSNFQSFLKSFARRGIPIDWASEGIVSGTFTAARQDSGTVVFSGAITNFGTAGQLEYIAAQADVDALTEGEHWGQYVGLNGAGTVVFKSPRISFEVKPNLT